MADTSAAAETVIDVGPLVDSHYFTYHRARIHQTIAKMREMKASQILEVGGHPWIMTGQLVDASFDVCATVSAEEITKWPDDIGKQEQTVVIRTPLGKQKAFTNYSANIERTLFDIEEEPDTVIACEILEHLIRSPHIMLLNTNRWLPIGGHLLVTTPNGAQFTNPLRMSSQSPAYRCNVYERHAFLYTLRDLVDLVSLCGFRIKEAGFWDPYPRTGYSRIYGALANVPSRYFREKFKKQIFLVAEKMHVVDRLAACPRVYDSRGDWEFIGNGPSAAWH